METTKFPIHRTLGVHSHSLPNTPTTNERGQIMVTVGEYGATWVNGEEGLMWPGSFYLDSQMAASQSQPSDQLSLDLTLKCDFVNRASGGDFKVLGVVEDNGKPLTDDVWIVV
ncbi:unnamed protein product [Lactuca saligna]|uniref:Uncharacterized protein n=1 Tax=Lactuca saligna TaxID=75948 RepID=A0AA36E8X1_LACSI|nr:unnamed protein product [Lactuca saligna]